MLIPAQLTEDERELLVDYHRDGCSSLIRDRALSVLLNSRGLSSEEIAQTLDRNIDTIRLWLTKFKKNRISSLFTRYKGNNNASKLTRLQKQQIKEVLKQPPSDYGIPKRFWQVKDLKKYIKAEFGIVYESKRSYHFLFKLGKFNWKLPDRFDTNRDDALVNRRLKEIREEIQPMLESSDWIVLASDETRLIWEDQLRRAWLQKGKKTVIKVHRDRQYQSFLGSLNLKTGKCHLHSLRWQNQAEVLKALKKLKRYYPGKKICLIWDNATWHKGKLIRGELTKGGELVNFHLINFPPYAPDTNPQEHVWKYAKDKLLEKASDSFRQKINNFKLTVIHRRFNYQI